jgi:transposase
LTLVYQIDLDVTRLLWVGRERTIESFRGFFAVIGDELASRIVFVCSDMWQPYLKVIREKCSEALHVLDRFHIVAKMNKALDEAREQRFRLRDLLRYNLKTYVLTFVRKPFSSSGITTRPHGPESSSMTGVGK